MIFPAIFRWVLICQTSKWYFLLNILNTNLEYFFINHISRWLLLDLFRFWILSNINCYGFNLFPHLQLVCTFIFLFAFYTIIHSLCHLTFSFFFYLSLCSFILPFYSFTLFFMLSSSPFIIWLSLFSFTSHFVLLEVPVV